jgi:hypothetical protein
MQIEADLGKRIINLVVDSGEAAAAFVKQAKEQSAFMISIPGRAQPFELFQCKLIVSGSFELAFQARLLQLLDQEGEGVGAVFELSGWEESKDLELQRKLATASATDNEDAAEGEAQGASPVFRIKSLDPGEKARLALKATKTERQILCRDTSPQVLLSLLNNPRIEAADVLQIVKSTHANAGLLQRVASDRRWSSNHEIQTAIVRNPKTPPPIAIKLLEQVPTRELRDMAKIGSLRETVRRAAFRIYQKRSGSR